MVTSLKPVLAMFSSPLPRSEIVAVPPVDCSLKIIAPPSAPLTPPLAVIVALPAVLVSTKIKSAPVRLGAALPLMTKLALAAVALPLNSMWLPASPLVVPPSAVKLPSAAVANWLKPMLLS
jgi:hypothetical protein